jgi:hypothetical protein
LEAAEPASNRSRVSFAITTGDRGLRHKPRITAGHAYFYGSSTLKSEP